MLPQPHFKFQSLTAGISIWTRHWDTSALWASLSPWQQGYLFEQSFTMTDFLQKVSVPDSRDIYLNKLWWWWCLLRLSPWQQGYLFELGNYSLRLINLSQSLTAGISIWTRKISFYGVIVGLSPWQQGYLFELIPLFFNVCIQSQSLTAGISIWTRRWWEMGIRSCLSPWQQGYLFEHLNFIKLCTTCVSVPDSRDIYLNQGLKPLIISAGLSPWQQGYLFEPNALVGVW